MVKMIKRASVKFTHASEIYEHPYQIGKRALAFYDDDDHDDGDDGDDDVNSDGDDDDNDDDVEDHDDDGNDNDLETLGQIHPRLQDL